MLGSKKARVFAWQQEGPRFFLAARRPAFLLGSKKARVFAWQQEGPRFSPSNMQPHSLSKGQLAAIALVLDEEELNTLLSDKKKRMWVHNCFRKRKSEGEY